MAYAPYNGDRETASSRRERLYRPLGIESRPNIHGLMYIVISNCLEEPFSSFSLQIGKSITSACPFFLTQYRIAEFKQERRKTKYSKRTFRRIVTMPNNYTLLDQVVWHNLRWIPKRLNWSLYKCMALRSAHACLLFFWNFWNFWNNFWNYS